MLSIVNAKINLGLYITEKRTDGFHNLQTVFYPVKIYDVVELIDAEETSINILGLNIPGNTNENLCYLLFKQMQEKYNLPNQKIILLKNIPVGAGLGGGSADTAFLLKLIDNKFALNLSNIEMQNIARQFGSDCAFFVENSTCFASGKGDKFEEIQLTEDLSKYFLVLVKPAIHVSTAEAYSNIKTMSVQANLKQSILLTLEQWKSNVKNDFEKSVFKIYPEIAKIKEQLYAEGAIFALMSGSGSSVFGIFEKPIQLPEIEENNVVFYNI